MTTTRVTILFSSLSPVTDQKGTQCPSLQIPNTLSISIQKFYASLQIREEREKGTGERKREKGEKRDRGKERRGKQRTESLVVSLNHRISGLEKKHIKSYHRIANLFRVGMNL